MSWSWWLRLRRVPTDIEDLMRNGNDAALTRLRTRLFNPDNIPSPGSSRIGTSLPNTPATPLTSHNGPGQLYPVTPSSSSNNPGIPVHMGGQHLLRRLFLEDRRLTWLQLGRDSKIPPSSPRLQTWSRLRAVQVRREVIKQDVSVMLMVLSCVTS